VQRGSIVGIALAAGLLLAGSTAQAGYRVQSNDWFWNYYGQKWCLSAMTELFECGYATFEQCNVAQRGVGGTCRLNPYYVERVQRRGKRVYR